MDTLDKMRKARTSLILDHPFFGSLALQLELEDSKQVMTCAVDGKHLFYNCEFIDNLPMLEVIGVSAHEVMHVALMHHCRMDGRDYERWNRACDYAINPLLIDSGFKLPEGALVEDTFRGMSAEKIYNRLVGSNKDPGGCGSVLPGPRTKKEQEEELQKWQAAVSQAVHTAAGSIDSNMKRVLEDEILNPAVPWYILLRDFVEKSARNDYDWSRPSRRYLNSGFVLPSLCSEQLPEVIIAIDTSRSINDAALKRFSKEASNVLEAYDTTVRVVYCDTKVKGEQIFTKADMPMKMKPVGGGGTRFKPVFEWIEKNGYTPACLIYFTDLYGRFPEIEPNYPTLWVTTTKHKKVPFGETVLFQS